MTDDSWTSANPYEYFMGRFSRPLARRVLASLSPPEALRWLDVGCGTGALSQAILELTTPTSVVGVDPSPEFIADARRRLQDQKAQFFSGDASHLPLADATVDHVIAGLALNFADDPSSALREMRRVTAPGGRVSAYVWDYAEGMQMLRYFWDAALAEDPSASTYDEGMRFALCRADTLERLFRGAGLTDVTCTPVELDTTFTDFDDYWRPFLGGQGPAPTYCSSLSDTHRQRLSNRLRHTIPAQPDGSLALQARAWLVTGGH
ncbi:MAG: class I SAM-dependent methyltransferase [Actinomycetes bacterium]